MSHDMYQVPDQTPVSDDNHKQSPSNRRGQNLSLADRARGGHNSAKQQRRDGGGRFAGSTKKAAEKPAGSDDDGDAPDVSPNGRQQKEMAWR